MTVIERRAQEVARQKRRNRKDLINVTIKILCLIAWAVCLAGFINGGLR
jgi:hypothetical protein